MRFVRGSQAFGLSLLRGTSGLMVGCSWRLLVRFYRRCDLFFGRCSLRLGFGRWLSWLDRWICGPEVPTALWALPELLRRPRVFRPGVFQVHLAAASLAAHADVWVVHGETDCSVLSK